MGDIFDLTGLDMRASQQGPYQGFYGAVPPIRWDIKQQAVRNAAAAEMTLFVLQQPA
jgi:hypothetical protein